MPVVHVVHKLFDTVPEKTQQISGFSLFEYGLRTPIEDVYSAVVRFIKWHNNDQSKE